MSSIPLEAYVCAALGVSIQLWKDATPTVRFPRPKELVRIELGRVLACKALQHRLGLTLSPHTRAECLAEPWDIDCSALLQAFVRDVMASRLDAQTVGTLLVERAHEDHFMLPPKQRSVHSKDDLQPLIKGIVACFPGPHDCSAHNDAITTLAYETYHGIHSAILRR